MKGPGIQQFKGNNSMNMKGSSFLSLQNFRYIHRFDFFFFGHVQNNERSEEKKKTEIEQSDYKVVFKGTIRD